MGFEPTVLVRGRQFSRLVHSTALPPLRGCGLRAQATAKPDSGPAQDIRIPRPWREIPRLRRTPCHGFLAWLCGDHGGAPAGGGLTRAGLRLCHAPVAGSRSQGGIAGERRHRARPLDPHRVFRGRPRRRHRPLGALDDRDQARGWLLPALSRHQGTALGRARRAGRDAGARPAGLATAPDRRRLPLQRVQSQGAYLLPRAVHRGAVTRAAAADPAGLRRMDHAAAVGMVLAGRDCCSRITRFATGCSPRGTGSTARSAPPWWRSVCVCWRLRAIDRG